MTCPSAHRWDQIHSGPSEGPHRRLSKEAFVASCCWEGSWVDKQLLAVSLFRMRLSSRAASPGDGLSWGIPYAVADWPGTRKAQAFDLMWDPLEGHFSSRVPHWGGWGRQAVSVHAFSLSFLSPFSQMLIPRTIFLHTNLHLRQCFQENPILKKN